MADSQGVRMLQVPDLQQQAHQQAAQMWTERRPVAKRDEYANHIEVERREYDAVLRFYVKRWPGQVPGGKASDDLVREITVPLGALDALNES